MDTSRSPGFRMKRAQGEVNIQQRLPETELVNHHHHLIPGINFNKFPWVENWDIPNVRNLFQDYPYHCDFPKPFLPPAIVPRTVMNKEDPASNIISIKSEIQSDVDRMVKHFKDHNDLYIPFCKQQVDWVGKKKALSTKVPKYIANLAHILENDPDPHFSGKYNWYCTGGTLDSLLLNERIVILLPFMGDLAAIPIAFEEKSMCKPLLMHSSKSHLTYNLRKDQFCEIRHNISSTKCHLLARFKHHCVIYTLTDGEESLDLVKDESIISKVPFISADLNPYNLNQCVTLNVAQELEMRDFETKKIISTSKIVSSKLDDNWGCIKHQLVDPNIISYTNRCCLNYFDQRISMSTPSLTLCPKLKLESCENISLHIPSHKEPQSYLGTYHSLLMVDGRSPLQCVCQKWTHQFESAPLFGSTLMRNGEEFVVISSQIPRETSIVVNNWKNSDNPHSHYLPVTPLSILDTLRSCQLQGKCLDPHLKSRLDLLNVGSQIVRSQSNDLFLFTQNSIGDVFYQCISYNEALNETESFVNLNSFYVMETWSKYALNQRNKMVAPLVLSDKCSMEHIFKGMSNTDINYKSPVYDEMNYELWREPIESLLEYEDILAPELLGAWQIYREEDASTLPISKTPHNKVLDWLTDVNPEKSDTEETQPLSQEISLTPVNTQELLSVSQQVRIDDTSIIDDAFCPPLKVVSKRTPKAKKTSRYTAGF